jgi:PKHD-type hydroxylase
MPGALLFDVDMVIVRLSQKDADECSLATLTGAYHNLLRTWGDA